MELISILFEMACLIIRLIGDLFLLCLCLYITWKVITGHDVDIRLTIEKRNKEIKHDE